VQFSGPGERPVPVGGSPPAAKFPVALARGKHLFPFRTEKLSPSAPMVLGPQGPGRVGRRRFLIRPPVRAAFFVLEGGLFVLWVLADLGVFRDDQG
jgi:hypothetical protein